MLCLGSRMTTSISNNVDDRVRNVIHHHPHLKKERVHFSSQKGKVTLKGQVSTFFEKQMAQEAIRTVDGVENVVNELVVDWR